MIFSAANFGMKKTKSLETLQNVRLKHFHMKSLQFTIFIKFLSIQTKILFQWYTGHKFLQFY
jgi:hypothetical protein